MKHTFNYYNIQPKIIKCFILTLTNHTPYIKIELESYGYVVCHSGLVFWELTIKSNKKWLKLFDSKTVSLELKFFVSINILFLFNVIIIFFFCKRHTLANHTFHVVCVFLYLLRVPNSIVRQRLKNKNYAYIFRKCIQNEFHI